MSVNVVLAVLGSAIVVAILTGVLWALTRAKDRIQLATACLFLCTLLYGGGASDMLSKGGGIFAAGLFLGIYALSLYAVMAVLAIYYKRWAWQVTVGAFALHLLGAVVAAAPMISRGSTGLASLAIWVAVGALGLYASLHRGSRELVEFLPSGVA